MDLSKLSITELKALKCDAYDNIANAQSVIQQAQQYLQVINEEIQKRQVKETKDTVSETAPKGDGKPVGKNTK